MTETTKAVKEAAPKKVAESKTVADLQKDLAKKQQDLKASMHSHQAGELVNPRILRITRKEIARLHTAIRAVELAEKESK